MKGMLIALRVRFPYTYDLAELLSLIEQTGQIIPDQIREAAKLSDYAVEARYPGLAEPVSREEYKEAVTIAELVISWAEGVIGSE